MMMSNKVYDVLKWFALIALDAIGLCYKAVAGIWGLPYGDEVSATCVAVSICLGALLGISTSQYNKRIAAARSMAETTAAEGVGEDGKDGK